VTEVQSVLGHVSRSSPELQPVVVSVTSGSLLQREVTVCVMGRGNRLGIDVFDVLSVSGFLTYFNSEFLCGNLLNFDVYI
jgi:hypothetical protein